MTAEGAGERLLACRRLTRCESCSAGSGGRRRHRERTSCATGGIRRAWPLAHDGARPNLVLDAGTGLRNLTGYLDGHPFRGTILLGHLHWDHTHGLPFFAGGDQPDSDVTVVMPAQGDPEEVLDRAFSPPHFPVTPSQLQRQLADHRRARRATHHVEGFHVVAARDPPQGRAHVRLPGVSDGGATVAYLSDHSPIGVRRRPRRPRHVPPGGHGPGPGRRRPHPRRPAHGGGVRRRSPTSATPPSSTRWGWRRRPACAPSSSSTTTRPHRRRARRHRRRPPRRPGRGRGRGPGDGARPVGPARAEARHRRRA